ncbi:hypothetical protein [Streptomyces sp. NPDC050564]|uniref:hypothetical protein n=1 Tax=Streptomyces sp. NPDC050564 TaxID=3365631 RepID=UPI0037BDCC50
MGDADAVVSLTSYGDRLRYAPVAIESIGLGSVRPRRLILWLADGESVNPSLRRLERRGLEIRHCADLGPHKKYWPYVAQCLGPAVADSAQLPLVTADDDVFYPRHWLSELVAVSKSEPGSVVCHRARTFGIANGVPVPYSSWHLCSSDRASYRNVATGVGGTLYPRSLQSAIFRYGQGFVESAPHADDLWLHWIAVKEGFPTRQVRSRPLRERVIPGTQAGALWLTNVEQGKNDLQLQRTYDSIALARIELSSTVDDSFVGELQTLEETKSD